MIRGLALLTLASCGHVDAHSDAGTDALDLCPMMSCDDNDPCTTDTCVANTCHHDSAAPTGMQAFAVTNSIVRFTVPACVNTITIDAFGGQGGSTSLTLRAGGMAAHVVTTLSLAKTNQILAVLVGGAGGTGIDDGGGGGGSFVWDIAAPAMPLVAAGGGGGAGYDSAGVAAPSSRSGVNGPTSTGGFGQNGNGATQPVPATNWAAGGAGWLTDGAAGGGPAATPCGVSVGGKSPAHGGAGGAGGGAAGYPGAGGFGGGGGAQGQCNATGGGGGGGYSGGAGGGENPTTVFQGGGGGGSFAMGTPTITGGVHTGDGAVTISW